ncbi:hypothetical protein K402DRAFT_443645 [Aulographum hederae CBS 113979]|uniref:Uncharacterized protein n=1 Tax=Aulographum hederae CBS 113979 TaxID=1176131 RepID=A0A6G1HEL1_9PEZI|nr:hypothetical protein K402DRAFT_443645 [Aulographum hederae CBS 113979]
MATPADAPEILTAEGNPRSHDTPWYNKEEPEVSAAARKLLREWSEVKDDNIVGRVMALRDKAWNVFPFPCIGQYRFLDLVLPTLPIYTDLLTLLKNPSTNFLDLGCCLGQELRQLALDGVSPSQLYGSDLSAQYLELGYELFGDHEKFSKATFIAADVFNEEEKEGEGLRALEGKMDAIYTGSFFHLFDYSLQALVAKRAVKLLKPTPGVLVLGRQIGNAKPGEYPRRISGGTRFRHDAATWKKLWEEVGAETGTKWDAQVQTEEWSGEFRKDNQWVRSQPEQTIRLRFVIRRIE